MSSYFLTTATDNQPKKIHVVTANGVIKIYPSLVIIICVVIGACSKSSPTAPPGMSINCSVPKTFSNDVLPITSTRCAISGCHGSGSSNGPGELITYQQIFNARSNIQSAVVSGLMPQGSSLSDAQISAIVCWIDSGAPNN